MAAWGSTAWGNATAAPKKSMWGAATTTPSWGATSNYSKNADVQGAVNPFGTRNAAGAAKQVGYLKPPVNVDTSHINTTDLSAPGTGENWYANNQQQINKSGDLGDFLHGAAGRLFGMDYQPTNATGAYKTMQDQLGGPQPGATNAWSVADQLRQKTAGEGIMGQAASMFGGPNLAHNYATDTAGFFRAPTSTQGYADSLKGTFGPGQGQTGAYGAAGQLAGGPGAAETNLTAADRALGGINYGDRGINFDANNLSNDTQNYAQQLGGFAQTTGGTGREATKFLPGLEAPSNSEALYASGNQGLDAAYARTTSQRSRELENRLAASGLFGSGATARGLEEIAADSAANQARDMASLAGQADQARIARTGAAQSFSSAADADALSRARLGLEGYQAGDQQNAQNVGLTNDMFGLASGEGLQKVGLRNTAASNAQTAATDRLFKGGSLGLDADRAGNERTRLGLDVNRSADDSSLARMLGGSTVATAGDQSLFDQGTRLGNLGHQMTADEISRLDTSSKSGIAGDTTNADRLAKLAAAGVNVDQLRQEAARIGVSVEQLLGNMTGQNDVQEWQRTIDRQNLATGAQDLFQGRTGKYFDQMMALAKAKAGITADATGKISDEQAQIVRDTIQGYITEGKMTQQEGDQLREDILKGGALFAGA